MKFLERKENTAAAANNLQGDKEANDDDSFASRGHRSLFVEESKPQEELADYTSRHSRSFLDPINFEEDPNEKDGLMATGNPSSYFQNKKILDPLNRTDLERDGIMSEGLLAQHNLMADEAIPIELSAHRRHDQIILNATRESKRKSCRDWRNWVGPLSILLGFLLLAMLVVLPIELVERSKARNNNLRISTTENEKLETPNLDVDFFKGDPKINNDETREYDDDDYENRWYDEEERDDDEWVLEGDDDWATDTLVPEDTLMPQPDQHPHSEYYCRDSPTFLHNGVHGETCKWVARSDTVSRCARAGVLENCRATCDPECSFPTIYPTEEPTQGPTDYLTEEWFPTMAPSVDPFPTENPTKEVNAV